MSLEETKKLIEELSRIAKERNLVVVTARQPSRPPGYRPWTPPQTGIVIVDYSHIVREKP